MSCHDMSFREHVVDKTTLVIAILHIFMLEMKTCEDMKRRLKNVGLVVTLAPNWEGGGGGGGGGRGV